jgi:hypothetical protein
MLPSILFSVLFYTFEIQIQQWNSFFKMIKPAIIAQNDFNNKVYDLYEKNTV